MGAAILGGLVIGCQFFASDPQTFIYSTLALMAYAAFRLRDVFRQDPGRESVLRPALSLAAMLVFAGLLSAVQLLPAMELAAHSNRAAINPTFTFLGSIPPIGLVSLVAPGFFGDEIHGAWGELFAPEFYFHSSTLYVGFFTLALVIVALLTRRNRWHVRFFGLLGLAVLWLALGKFGYLYRVAPYVPVLKDLRDIENINVLLPLCAAVLAGFGFDRFLEPGRVPEVWRTTLRILFLVMGAEILLAGITILLQKPYIRVDLPQSAQMLRTMGTAVALALIAFGISAGLLWGRSRSQAVPAWVRTGAMVFIVADLLYFGFPIVNAGTGVGALERDDAVTRYLARDKSLHRIYGLDIRGMLFSLQESGGNVGLLLRRYSEYTNFVQGYDIESLIRPAGPHGVLFSKAIASPLLALLNVKYFVGGEDLLRNSGLGDDPGSVSIAPGVFIYRSETVYPRVLDSYAYKLLDDKLAILRALSRKGYDPHQFIILERKPDLPRDFFSPGDATGRPAALNVVSYSGNRVVVKARFFRPGFLLLNDLYYPEWAAALDGYPTPIYRANYLFRAVAVPTGRHRVTFVYRSRAFEYGAVVSALAGVAGLVVWLLDRMSQHKMSGPPAG